MTGQEDATICLPCGLADRLGEQGPHDCVGTMAVLDEVGAGFVTVICACRDCHPKGSTPTPDPRRGDGG